ncbi:hypothetical protein [Microvirga pakistanensis]|uniref:hypothetical protein n=1 Tax=Microvirga pakistanensis TaxID=1682650 RepID=UPI00141B950F|nr:hypothetical protein [Microvirga pakistanensis]
MQIIFVILVALIVISGWLLYEIARFDACLDRFNYDKALWHRCEEDPAYRPSP